MERSKERMHAVDDSNRYSFGKIHLKINGIDNINNFGNLFVRILVNPFVFETKTVKHCTNYKEYNFF